MLSDKRRKSGFTLIEMIITMVITTIVIGGLSFIFLYMSGNFLVSQYANKSYEKALQFKNDFLSQKNANTEFLALTGGILKGDKYGFSAAAFTNSGQTGGFIIGAYDQKNKKVAYGNSLKYSDYIPFIYVLDSDGVNEAKDDFGGFLDNLDTSNISRYSDVKLFKLGYYFLNVGSSGKLDITVTPEYYSPFFNRSYSEVMDKSDTFFAFRISVVK